MEKWLCFHVVVQTCINTIIDSSSYMGVYGVRVLNQASGVRKCYNTSVHEDICSNCIMLPDLPDFRSAATEHQLKLV